MAVIRRVMSVKFLISVAFMLSNAIYAQTESAPQSKPLDVSLIKGKDAKITDFEQALIELARSGKICDEKHRVGGIYITPYYIDLQTRKKGLRNLDNEKKIKVDISTAQKSLAKLQCIFVNLKVKGSIQDAQFKNWVIKIKDSSGNVYETKPLMNGPFKDLPKPEMHNGDTVWGNHNMLCTQKSFKPEEGFSVYLIPQKGCDETLILGWEKPPMPEKK